MSKPSGQEKEIKDLQEKVEKLSRANDWLSHQVSFLLDTLKREAGPLRHYTEPCPGIDEGRFVLGNKVFGRVTWVGKGHGIWRGQQVCKVDGYDSVMATNRLVVL